MLTIVEVKDVPENEERKYIVAEFRNGHLQFVSATDNEEHARDLAVQQNGGVFTEICGLYKLV